MRADVQVASLSNYAVARMTNAVKNAGWWRRLSQLIGGAGLMLAAAPMVLAQGAPVPAPTGIEGVVVDSAGRPLSNVRLLVRDTARIGAAALRRNEATSDSAGLFRIIGLPAGGHVLEVTRDE